jgi:hypothetical protein
VVLDDVSGSVNVRGWHVDSTIERLLAAAEGGKSSDIAEATESVVRVPRSAI